MKLRVQTVLFQTDTYFWASWSTPEEPTPPSAVSFSGTPAWPDALALINGSKERGAGAVKGGFNDPRSDQPTDGGPSGTPELPNGATAGPTRHPGFEREDGWDGIIIRTRTPIPARNAPSLPRSPDAVLLRD